MRSKLFVPAVRSDWFSKALASCADAVCFDLEDTVPAERKAEARKAVSEFMSSLDSAESPPLLFRVNPATSADLPLDLRAVVRDNLYAIAMPKVETVAEIQ